MQTVTGSRIAVAGTLAEAALTYLFGRRGDQQQAATLGEWLRREAVTADACNRRR
jgi:hypothetical protein